MEKTDDPSTLTSFVPLTPEVSNSTFSLGKLFDFARKKSTVGSKTSSILEESQEVESSGKFSSSGTHYVTANKEDTSQSLTSSCSIPSTSSSPSSRRKEKSRYRNVKTILRRLSAIAIDRRWHQTSGDFKSDFKQYWMPDEQCKECYECGERFNVYRRKHHCRVCGQIFCSRCCNHEVSGKVLGFTGDIRVCNYCHKIVLAYSGDDPASNIEALSEDFKAYAESSQTQVSASASLSLSSSRTSLSTYNRDDPIAGIRRVSSANNLPTSVERDLVRSPTPFQRNLFDAFGVAPSEANTIKLDYLRHLWRQITHPSSELELQSHRYRLKTYHNCFIGHEVVDWLITNGHANSRFQGVSIGQHFLDNGWIEAVPATIEVIFHDEYMLYQPGKTAIQDLDTHASQTNVPTQPETSATETEALLQSSLRLESGFRHVDDDDDSVPVWFRQLSTNTPQSNTDPEAMYQQQQQQQQQSQTHNTPAVGRRVSSGRHLDLDHVDAQDSDDAKSSELSLQMKLDHFSDEPEQLLMRREGHDHTSKLSLITHVPPPSLDTYVCVEGHPFTSKKKLARSQGSVQLVEEIPHGVMYPKPSAIDPPLQECNDHGEILSLERLICASSTHLNALADQIIHKQHLSPSWKDVMMPLVNNVSQTVVPDVCRDDDMDIRQYVWFKKVPIGDKSQCHLVRGVVCSKNVAHKKMIQLFLQPKILMLGCAIEYQRVENKLASLDPLVLQEYEFLKNFVARVLILKPNLVLVEKSVARVAQDMFLAANITLVHNVKDTVMESIARCTGADILQSMEQVTRPRLGSCQTFRLQKHCLPGDESKTLMFFEGCPKYLGCSIVLHGPSRKELKKVQTALEYLIYVAYHLKLESKFLLDEFAMPPQLDTLLPKDKLLEDLSTFEESLHSESNSTEVAHFENDNDNFIEGEVGYKFKKTLGKVILSSSPFCRYPVPYLLTKAGQECSSRMFIAGKIYWSENLDGMISNGVEDENEKTGIVSVNRNESVNPNVVIKPPHRFTHPDVAIAFYDGSIGNLLADYRAQGGQIQLKMYHDFEERMCKKRKGIDVGKQPFVQGKWSARIMNKPNPNKKKAPEELKIQLGYMGDEKERQQLDCFDAYNHQRIAVLFTSYSSESHNAPKPCISPWAVFMEFYGRNDITLGGFLERYCFRPSYICPSHNCDVPMVNHVRYFAHGNGSLYIHMRNLESRIPGFDHTILTWSWCKQCKQVTPVVPLSRDSWSLSFAKYLELRFYGKEYTRRASAEPCNHSIHHEHFQYFSFANMVASFKFCPIDLLEIVIPAFTVHIGKEKHNSELVDQVQEFSQKSHVVLSLVVDRIQSLKYGEQMSSASRDAKIKEFLAELNKERFHFNECIQLLQMKTNSFVLHRKESEEGARTSVSSNDSSCYHDSKDVLNLNPSEVSGLVLDIQNLMIKLKRTLCELVEAWNATLLEYIQLEKKREKSPRPQSPPRETTVPAELGEYYPTVSNTEQLYHEPVSEVFLTNGTILRQTFLGTSVPIENPVTNVPIETQSTDIPIESESNEQEKQQPCPSAFSDPLGAASKVSDKTIEKSINENKNVNLEDKTAASSKEALSDVRTKIGSPYMVIQSPTAEFEKAIDKGPIQDVNDGQLCVSRAASVASDNNSTNAEHGSVTGDSDIVTGNSTNIAIAAKRTNALFQNSPGSIASSNLSGGWCGDNKSRSDTVIAVIPESDKQSDSNSIAGSLFVEGGSDADPSEIPTDDNDGVIDDNASNLPESECLSDVDTAEEAGASVSSDIDGVNDIHLGESAVDFEKRRNASGNDTHSLHESDNFESDSSNSDIEDPMERMKSLLEDLKVVAPHSKYQNESTSNKNSSIDASQDGIIKQQVISRLRSMSPPVLPVTLPQSPKKLGHRRMSSAPLSISKPKRDDSYIDSPITPGSPFIDVDQGPNFPKGGQQRSGSVDGAFFSYHNAAELKQLAEEVCKEDRKDVERDDPFEIQTQNSQPADEVAPDTTQEAEKPRASSHGEESLSNKTASSSSTSIDKSKKSMSLGRVGLHKTVVASKSARSADIKDETDLTRSLSTSEVAITGKRGGSEKMKKIISHLLPSSSYQAVPMPFPAHEHFMPPSASNIAIVINEKEPTSIIAYALSMKDYEVQLNAIIDFTNGKNSLESSLILRQPINSPLFKRRANANSSSSNSHHDTLAPTNNEGVVLRRKHGVNSQVPRPSSWTGGGSASTLMSLQELSELPSHVAPLSSSPSKEALSGDPLHVSKPSSLLKAFESSKTDSFSSSLDDQSIQDQNVKQDYDSQLEESLMDEKFESGSIGSSFKDEKKKEESPKKEPSLDYHIKLQFHDRASKFYCSIYFANQFKELRELIFPEGEERYLQSLSRCVLWRASGGKSGSSFSKSLDDRFVLKQMSRLELQSFTEFAPYYFQYVTDTITAKRPTVFAKLLGVYRIGFKNTHTNTTMRQDILVMENLFYKRKANKIFDLKGSVRSRYVHTAGKEDVLMDENFLEMISESPLFIRPHSKAILSKAIHNDTEFLARYLVMDYSLLVGIDEANSELVVGIIDYIRTFTWDKKLESYVKSTGILGGQGKMPTVVSPAVYRTRFTEAMHRYFLMVPDKWTGFGADLN